ncbi:MAG: xanthine dehydrogenase family protein subunit M [Elusimicrobia bacterium]|nr:xanthine dehydrogenase family protein subunit M [Elusimicrobiota bacterium]
MRGCPQGMTVLRPQSAGEAVSLFAENPAARPLAGGTDFMVLWNMGEADGQTMLDLSGVREWRSIRKTAAGLSIGALVTHAELRDDPVVRREFPLLAQAASVVGAEQIQNRGTLGGNIANASPAADTLPALAVYEATVKTVSRKGARGLPLLQTFAGVKRTSLEPGELIAAIDIPYLPKKPYRQLFRKVGTRAALAISKTVAAGLVWLERDRTVRELRFALGSMAPTVRRLRAAEDMVRGKRLSRELAAEACELLPRDVSPIDDLRSTAAYRLHVSQNLLSDFLLG